MQRSTGAQLSQLINTRSVIDHLVGGGEQHRRNVEAERQRYSVIRHDRVCDVSQCDKLENVAPSLAMLDRLVARTSRA